MGNWHGLKRWRSVALSLLNLGLWGTIGIGGLGFNSTEVSATATVRPIARPTDRLTTKAREGSWLAQRLTPVGTVLVEFEAIGSDWLIVWIDNRPVYRAQSFNRRQAIQMVPGAYRVIVTGIVKSDIFAAGYLDVADNTAILRVRVSRRGGLVVPQQPWVWLPDAQIDPIRTWER